MRIFKPRFKDRQTGEQRETQKWYVDFLDQKQIRRRIPAERCATENQAQKFGEMIEALVVVRQYNDKPDRKLADWLHGLPANTLRKLAEMDLIGTESAAAGVLLAKHLEDFEGWLKTTKARHGFNRNATYVRNIIAAVRHVFTECKCRYWNDITRSAVETCLGRLDVSTKTYDEYLAAIKYFCTWMVDNSRAETNPVAKIKRVKIVKTEERRSLDFDEMCKLLSATVGEPERYGMKGLDRAVCYLLACETGFRVNEIRQLTVGCFDFDNACVTQAARACKNRTEATQFLKRERAKQFRKYFDGKPADARAFNMPSSKKTADMIREDLEAAGIKPTRYVGTKPIKVVFHSLRHTLGSALDRSGATDKERHMIGRWSDTNDLSLGTYTHVSVLDLRAAVERLPDYPWPGDMQAQQNQQERVA